MRHFAVSAIGRDRPGIVAAVSEVLLDHQANIEDSQMTILRGHFTMTLIVSAPDTADHDTLEAELRRVGERLALEAWSVSDVEELEGDGHPEPSHILTVYGIDHPGIVNAISSTLAGEGVSITDLTTRVLGDEGETLLYAMIIEIALPSSIDASELERKLLSVGDEQKVEVSFRELEQDTL
jgi:glycine cleavage system transcriptional repressor